MLTRTTTFRGWAIAFIALALAATGGTSLAAADAAPGDAYTLATCPVSGKLLGSSADTIVKNYDGREVRFCCGGCPAKFEANPAMYTEKMDAALAMQQLDAYPLDTCIVNGRKIGRHGLAALARPQP